MFTYTVRLPTIRQTLVLIDSWHTIYLCNLTFLFYFVIIFCIVVLYMLNMRLVRTRPSHKV
jgi:hypothetical protein